MSLDATSRSFTPISLPMPTAASGGLGHAHAAEDAGKPVSGSNHPVIGSGVSVSASPGVTVATVAVASSLAVALDAERSARLRAELSHDRITDRLTREARDKDRQIGDLLLRLHEAESRAKEAEAEVVRVTGLKMGIATGRSPKASPAHVSMEQELSHEVSADGIQIKVELVEEQQHEQERGTGENVSDDDHDGGDADASAGTGAGAETVAVGKVRQDKDDDDEDDEEDRDMDGAIIEDVVEIEPGTGRARTATASRPPSPIRGSSVTSRDEGDETDTEVVHSLFDSLKRVL